jgi:peptide deformylase
MLTLGQLHDIILSMKLTHVPHPLLASPCAPLTAEQLRSETITDLVKKMEETMLANNGIGLAANQVGKDLSLFIIDKKLAAEHEVPTVYANPEITEYGREKDTLEEGCLSIPGLWVDITRSKKIMFKALDGEGNKIKFKARGMLARVLQHETDHLNGTTIKDHAKKK